MLHLGNVCSTIPKQGAVICIVYVVISSKSRKLLFGCVDMQADIL